MLAQLGNLADLELLAAAVDDVSDDDTKQGNVVDESGFSQQRRVRGASPMLWALLAAYLPTDVLSLQKNFVRHLEYTLCVGERPKNQTDYLALAHTVRDHLVERWKDTQMHFHAKDPKRVYYLSMEYLMGRTLQNAIVNLGLEESISKAMNQLGVALELCIPEEKDAGLGNGGLGRLAACFVDSLATQNYPAWGYGLRYQYGMFFQRIRNGAQVEEPDFWLNFGNPWEIERLDVTYVVQFGGHCSASVLDGADARAQQWQAGETVLAVAYDTPIPGFDTHNTLNIRLWSSRPPNEFNLDRFNQGDYYSTIEARQRCENITHVLYPNDNTSSGKELRLRQEYFFVCATLQDIMRRFKRHKNRSWSQFSEKAAIQLNDTHPSLAIAELMRLLLDVEGLSWEAAWAVVSATFSYTNHTVLPEALERWSVDLMRAQLPRHMQIIFDINARFLAEVEHRWPGDIDRMRNMSIIDEHQPRTVRMAHLAVVGSHAVNGVAKIHSEIVRTIVFADFAQLWPHKFFNVTNGVTPRRWLGQANTGLAGLLSELLDGDKWLTDLDQLANLRSHIDNASVRQKWRDVKFQNKVRLAAVAKQLCGVSGVDPHTMLFDVHVKRFHEYKRQLLNLLSVIYRYRTIKNLSDADRAKVVPRAVFFGGKAAPGYFMAKLIIKLINGVAAVINNDPSVAKLLKVVFVPNYNVSLCEVIVPASDISQHISTAGTEASGTSNMKFAMNGGVIIGTLDGANIEIRDNVGHENMFIFGALADQINSLRQAEHENKHTADARFKQVLGMIQISSFGDVAQFQPLIDSLSGGRDHYLVGFDFPSYLDAQARVDEAYRDQDKWTRMSMANTAGMGYFSSDRSIREYAEQIWKVQPCRRPGPVPISTDSLDASLHEISKKVGSSDSNSINISVERFGSTLRRVSQQAAQSSGEAK
jgi:starch phosphorylase